MLGTFKIDFNKKLRASKFLGGLIGSYFSFLVNDSIRFCMLDFSNFRCQKNPGHWLTIKIPAIHLKIFVA